MRTIFRGRASARYLVDVSRDGKTLVIEENIGKNRVELAVDGLEMLVQYMKEMKLIASEDLDANRRIVERIGAQERIIERQRDRISELEDQCRKSISASTPA